MWACSQHSKKNSAILSPGEPGESPNRVDGCVWACTELLLNETRAGTWGR